MTDDKLRAALIGLAFERKSTGEYCWCGQTGDKPHFAECLAARAALAASATDEGPDDERTPMFAHEVIENARPAVPALDVERLAVVINRLDCIMGEGITGDDPPLGLDYGTAQEWAEAIAREYAALSPKEPTDAP